jgi:hypothetical protein
MATFQSLCFGIFLLGYYYFVLRKYNTLGFRMFSLFFFISLSVCYWWYSDYRDLKDIQKNGVHTQALVIKKAPDNIGFQFKNPAGKLLSRAQKEGISIEEFASVREGAPAPVLYSTKSDVIFLTASYERQLSDNIYILIFPGTLFLIGCTCWIFLRKYRVHAREGSIYEYVTDENGKIVLDDAANATTRSLRTYTTMSKLFSLFEK